jgi:molecular chaperone GrpE (heat shock protein)
MSSRKRHTPRGRRQSAPGSQGTPGGQGAAGVQGTARGTVRGAAGPADLLVTLDATRKDTVDLYKKITEHADRTLELATALSEHDQSIRRLLWGLVEVVDSFDRLLALGPDTAFESYLASVRSTANMLTRMLADNGVELIGRQGEIADPDTHQLVDVTDTPDAPEDTVLSVVRHGIRYRGKLIRPAAVITSVNRTAAKASKAANAADTGSVTEGSETKEGS